MIDIIEVIKASSPDATHQWKNLITALEKREKHLLALLSSLFAHAENFFLEIINETGSPLSQIITKQTLMDFIQRDLTNLLLPLISRVCIYEMYVVAENHKLQGETPEKRFDYFVSLLSDPKTALLLFEKYPLLKTLIDTVYQQYLENQTQLMQRLANDYKEICQFFFKKKIERPLFLTRITSAGDRHNQGRCVSILEFSNEKDNFKLVYKPRSLRIDQAFQQLIDWFNQKLSAQLYCPKILLKPEYGWCEFITYTECKNKKEVALFYQRLGILLGISHLLASTDIHAENIIAHGSHPVFVDFECALRPLFKSDDQKPSPEVPPHLVSDTALLPARFMAREDYNGIDLSGIFWPDEQEAPYRRMCWKKLGTDEMYLVREKSILPTQQNMPRLKHDHVDPLSYEKEISSGFTRCYQLILDHKKELLSDHSPLNAFQNVPIRVLFRATVVYAKLLFESYHPLLLYDNDKRRDHFLWLKEHAKPLIFSEEILDSEINDLLSNNIPYFSCQADKEQVFSPTHQQIALQFRFSGLERVKQHLIHRFNKNDLRLQLLIIENSFMTLRLNRGLAYEKNIPVSDEIPSSSRNIKDEAFMLAKKELDRLTDYAIIGDNRIMWPCIEMVGSDAWSPAFTDISLYKGIAGISLVFAYAASLFESKPYERIARLGLNSLIEVFSEQKKEAIVSMGVGAFTGLGGLIYALDQFIPDKRIRPMLEILFTWMDEFIEKDNILDVLSGSAGFIPLLLSAQSFINPKRKIMLLKKVAKHILTQYPNPAKLFTGYKNPYANQPLLGASHGAAGFIWALVKANYFLHDKNIEQWIKSALAYERSHFDYEKNNWPSFQKQNREHYRGDKFMTAWCHGAAGIGLTRLDSREFWQDDLIDEEIDRAIQTTLKEGFSLSTTLCHGDLGNLDFLLEASQKNPSKKLQDIFHTHAVFVVERIKKHGISLDIRGTLPFPGLMLGVAGVAYQLMRVAEPQRLPSILLLKLPTLW
ncbi:type 2 lanthipeptide synthetase LanM family protein [Coxiella burnetii]|uniref:type 2 lanthipeptide synthetase LanM family protein n=1 Tax=Coxiella burnetii TaxID=777 RepID=UPI001EE01526|nr:type 2 lanthipeptide synthetase LanM family protein [Coxiella burnetii]UYK68948.1 type 2 lanthipeptide synthetase LanM family protein [Coxiella burnetii]